MLLNYYISLKCRYYKVSIWLKRSSRWFGKHKNVWGLCCVRFRSENLYFSQKALAFVSENVYCVKKQLRGRLGAGALNIEQELVHVAPELHERVVALVFAHVALEARIRHHCARVVPPVGPPCALQREHSGREGLNEALCVRTPDAIVGQCECRQ